MSDLKNIFDISGRAMSAQLVRLNTIASNLANAGSMEGSKEAAYKAIRPVFETEYSENFKRNGVATTGVTEIVQLEREPEAVYMPSHPKSDENGFVYLAAVSQEEEMVDMMEANRQYQNNVEVITTIKALMMQTVNLGK